MPMACAVCSHEERSVVDEALVVGRPLRELSSRFGMSPSSLSRHRRDHVSVALQRMSAERETAGAASALDRVEALYVRAVRVLDAAEEDGKSSLSLAAIREVRSLVELLAKITGELDESTRVQVVNLQTSSEWLALRSVLGEALAPFPDAAKAVSSRLAALEPAGGA